MEGFPLIIEKWWLNRFPHTSPAWGEEGFQGWPASAPAPCTVQGGPRETKRGFCTQWGVLKSHFQASFPSRAAPWRPRWRIPDHHLQRSRPQPLAPVLRLPLTTHSFSFWLFGNHSSSSSLSSSRHGFLD